MAGVRCPSPLAHINTKGGRDEIEGGMIWDEGDCFLNQNIGRF
jgi:hypothetical protein